MVDKASTDAQPIIIKRKKVVQGDGHHGGAWKVAYADFVTAMMAFFLLMWLLNATTEEQRKGIADYFNPTIPVSRISGGGSDGLNGSSMFTEDTYAKMGTGGTRDVTIDTPKKEASATAADASAEEVAENLQNLRAELNEDAKQLSEHLMIKMSPEGMVLEIIDSDSSPLFMVGSSNPTPLLQDLLTSISGSLDAFRNDIKIVGHTDSLQYRLDANYDNWNLSTDRANMIRKLLLEKGMRPSRLKEVSGRADTDPLAPDDPSASQNRRISIVILTNQPNKDELRL
ncbi:MAG: chemotaxis protein MotB [Hyphomonas sp.]|uniref:Chemotaxis protein MotB n=1 Tax=Hyphomonas atlantica TaxID=1280948 RepID=A0A3B9KYY8_9PROT|nr:MULTISPECIES: flagellar motor protein MotB [Hyphomonas]OUX88737.1 MAG: chemotaxis protein MotB [Hyphomonas sp. TMED31]MAH92230.1 chemotaxis protein MotB [Hyphomonas sp.]MAM07057.1 chemotaxis protein MotB [Hyphomonas sp.]HAE93817.1 chemotaxis protein MotB [Hyphomonas atlantica]HBH43136.1 chemotaxis protein MotB [Hyphomonas atlantica]|tara:strand:+ start:2075 stop:2929 length:855 start_codon:yes stop_codon:yes gene_type:complete